MTAATVTPKPQLDVLYFKLFDDCNARCNMCTCWELPRTRRDTEYYVDVLDRLLPLRPAAVRFTGGEPLLLPGLPELVERTANTGARVSVITNGRVLCSKAARLADAGCVEIVLSLDAVGPAHDQIRATPGLFEHCMRGIDALSEVGLAYGVNTVVQRTGIADLTALAELLLARPIRPRWWHLIPVRDYPGLAPTPAQQAEFHKALPAMRESIAEHGIDLVADETMFVDTGPQPCEVPWFTAYASADTGELFGCNMLSHRDLTVGTFVVGQAEATWLGPQAAALRRRCQDGVNDPCRSCDWGSQAMNHLLRALAITHHGAGRDGAR
ncbi:MAG: radical SAM/SPASM domain-containing protein [Pseudonocardiaceae bacterium]